jgi:hypothetical protein
VADLDEHLRRVFAILSCGRRIGEGSSGGTVGLTYVVGVVVL